MSDDKASLEKRLRRARRALEILQDEAALHPAARVPVELQVEIEEQEEEVARLEKLLGQLQGTVAVPDTLQGRAPIFVGRGEEIAFCMEALSPEDRGWGVVIDGIGGMGKTALALAVAHRAKAAAMFDAYLFASAKTTWLTAEGVRSETLALTTLDAFCREFARGLGLQEVVQIRDATERRAELLRALQGRRALLIFDNLETLTQEERDNIAEFLRKLPGANKAIATSRRRTGESARTLRLDKLSEGAARELMQEFGVRHSRVRQELAGAEELQRALYEAVGGNPLALDWALGLVAQRGYGVRAVIEQLQDPELAKDLYGFLFGEAVTGLSKGAQQVLSVLAALRAPATVAALVDMGGLAERPVQVAIEELVTLSLASEVAGGRYGLQPLTRNYVRQALQAGKLEPQSQRQVWRYWVDYAQRYGGWDKDAYKTFDKLEAEWPQLESVAYVLYDRSREDANIAGMLIELHYALSNFLWFRGFWDERIRLSEWRYEAGRAWERWQDAGWGAHDVAFIHYNRKETERAAVWAKRMAETMERGGDRRDSAVAKRLQGIVAEQRGELTEAEGFYLEALAEYRALKEEKDEAIALNDLGNIARDREDYAAAESYYRQALAVAEKLDEKEMRAYVSNNLGQVALDRDRPKEARSWHERALKLSREVGREDVVAAAQSGLAQVLEQEARYAEALELAEAALAIYERLRDKDLEFSRQQVRRLREKLQR